jgi:hypothetical protein
MGRERDDVTIIITSQDVIATVQARDVDGGVN